LSQGKGATKPEQNGVMATLLVPGEGVTKPKRCNGLIDTCPKGRAFQDHILQYDRTQNKDMVRMRSVKMKINLSFSDMRLWEMATKKVEV